MHKIFLTSLILVLVCGLLSCKKDPDPSNPVLPEHPVFVVCEGSLGNGNSALTLYNRDSGTATENIYQLVNNRSMGDVFQSITRIGGRYFLCINNSDRILVINGTSLLLEGTIFVQKPRYILPVGPSKAYVSSIFDNRLFVINPQNLSVTDTIEMPFKNPEGMLLSGNTAYVCCWDTANRSLHAINTQTDQIERSIPVSGPAPQEIVQDKDGMLWVLSGNKASGVESKLTRLHAFTGGILKGYSFGSADPLRLVMNPAKDSLYFLQVSYSGGSANNGVYRMDIHDAALPGQALISAQGLQYFWGLDIDPVTGHIYVADPVGFSQRGKVNIYRQNATLLGSFATGVGPGHFLFD